MIKQAATEIHDNSIDVQVKEVRTPEELQTCDGLILPGGESTAMGIIAQRWKLIEPLKKWVEQGKPMFGTCAGMILLSNDVLGQKTSGQQLIGGIDMTSTRNHYGRQDCSFECKLDVPALGKSPIEATFIRAPGVARVGEKVQVLAQVTHRTNKKLVIGKHEDLIREWSTEEEQTQNKTNEINIQQYANPVAVRQGNLVATSFHPELTKDSRFHQYFLSIVKSHKGFGTNQSNAA
jgi:5'-phosphate synthase pdxT subunit